MRNTVILFLSTLLALFILSGQFSVVFFFTILTALLSLSKNHKQLKLNTFFLGIICSLFFLIYWQLLYDNVYFLGRLSDDWQYDVFWTDGFIEKYGLNLLKLPEHLNSIEKGLGILHNSQGYVALVIILKFFGNLFDGYHTLLPRILNIFFLVLISGIVGDLIHHYTKKEEKYKVAYLATMFYPIMIFNSSHVFRDTLVTLLIMTVYKILLIHSKGLNWVIKLLFCFILLILLRTSTFFILLLLSGIILSNPKKLFTTKLITISLVLILGSVIFLNDYYQVLFRQIESYNELNIERFGTIGSAIFKLPIYIGAIPRVAYLIFTPVPNFSGFHQIFLSISAFLQIYFFPSLYRSLRNPEIDLKLKLAFLTFFLGVAFSTATFRHVMMYIPFGIMLVTINGYNLNTIRSMNKKDFLLIILLFLILFISIAMSLLLA